MCYREAELEKADLEFLSQFSLFFPLFSVSDTIHRRAMYTYGIHSDTIHVVGNMASI